MQKPQARHETPYRPMRTLASAPERLWEVWRTPGRFTKNPDVVMLPNGHLLAICSIADKHWPEGLIELLLIESVDRGQTWGNPRVLASSDRAQREPRWVTPRISRLSDGRLAVLCDQDDYEHCHEYQPSGTYVWWSKDNGETWSESVNTGIPGIEPDRMVELPGGRFAIGSHMAFADTQKLGQFVCLSDDRGETWSAPVIIAKDAVHNYCEGAILPLFDGSLVCVIRDNNHNNYPCQVAFSFDNGERWTEPTEAPFSGDRPFIGQLADGRLLVTYRNQGGNRGTYAWLGDITRETGYRCTARHLGAEVIALDAVSGLHISHPQPATTQYNLLPPEDFRSEIVFEARVRVAGEREENCAVVQIAHVDVRLSIRPEGVYLGEPTYFNQLIDRFWPADMTVWHTIRIHHRGGLLRVYLDGRDVLRYHVLRDAPLTPTFFGTATDSTGESWWQHVKYHVRNLTEPEHVWLWDMHRGKYPDQYESDRVLELHANTHAMPDNGYSAWHQFADGEIRVLDYTNEGDPLGQAHVVGCALWVEDFETMGRRGESSAPPSM